MLLMVLLTHQMAVHVMYPWIPLMMDTELVSIDILWWALVPGCSKD
jgi:hypothetical protein